MWYELISTVGILVININLNFRKILNFHRGYRYDSNRVHVFHVFLRHSYYSRSNIIISKKKDIFLDF